MTEDFNYNNIKCAKCGYDQNPSNTRKCHICGNPLKKALIPPAIYIILAIMLAVGGGYFVFKKLTGESQPEATVTNPNSAISTTSPSAPITTPTTSPSAPITNPNSAISTTSLSAPITTPTTSPSAPITTTQPTVVETPPTNTAAINIDTSLPNPTILSMDGSTTMVALIQRLRNAFAQANPNIPTTYGQPNGFPKGSGKGIEALMKNSVVMAATSRPLKPQEAQAGIQVVAIARDAVAVVVGVNNPFKGSLSQEQLSQIFQGKITNWSQVGGTNAPIKVINRAVGSGTRDFFESVVLLGLPFAPNSANFTTFPHDETTGILRLVGNDGISYATVSQVENQQLVKIVPINNVSPVDKTAIQDGRYPISRNVYLAIRQQNSPVVKQFIDLALSPQGQQIVQQSNFIPLK
jgi:phosphate transport system substrate-binding protein